VIDDQLHRHHRIHFRRITALLGNGVTQATSNFAGNPTGGTVAMMWESFTPANWDLANKTIRFTPNGLGGWDVTTPCTVQPASHTSYGAGCYNISDSVYQSFASAALASPALSNTAITFTPTGAGAYVVTSGGSFLPVGSVQPTPIALVMNDDSEVTQTFTVGSFQGPNGPWTSFSIVSNGVISELAGHPAAAAGGGSPNNNTYLNAAPTAFYNLADWDPSAATGGGNVWYEESAGVTTITWENVPNWTATPPAAGVNTFQFQLYPSGIVTIAWSGANLSSFGNNGGALIGYSPGGTNLEPGATDISAIGAGSVQIVAADIPPTTLSSVNRPVFGTTWNLTVSNIEPSSFVGIDIFGVADPGVNDLSFLGLPGCGIRSSLDVTSAWIVTGSTHNYGLAIPAGQPALQGFNLYTTSATFQAIPQNLFTKVGPANTSRGSSTAMFEIRICSCLG